MKLKRLAIVIQKSVFAKPEKVFSRGFFMNGLVCKVYSVSPSDMVTVLWDLISTDFFVPT